MNITEVRITPLENSKTLAMASITIDNDFVVTGLRILNGQNGLWVAMPSRKGNNDEYHDIVFPVTREARQTIQEKVLSVYRPSNVQEALEQQGERNRQAPVIEVAEEDLPF